MTATSILSERYQSVKERIARAAARAGSRADQIVLVAVTKNAEPDQIRELIGLGHADFGENRVQHLLQRAAMIDEWLGRQRAMPRAGSSYRAIAGGLAEPAAGSSAPGNADAPGTRHSALGTSAAGGVRWHMIGRLQRNKVKKVLDVCRLVQSVDSLRLAEEIQAAAMRRDRIAEVLLQVNPAGEGSKGGCAPAAAPHLAEQLETMVHVRLRGLMVMAPYNEKPEDSRWTFATTRELFEEIRESGAGGAGANFNILSMGMSGDFEVAIQEGSNMVRVGTAIFGEGPAGQAAEAPEEPDDGDEP
jgi:hypothetical protein